MEMAERDDLEIVTVESCTGGQRTASSAEGSRCLRHIFKPDDRNSIRDAALEEAIRLAISILQASPAVTLHNSSQKSDQASVHTDRIRNCDVVSSLGLEMDNGTAE